jgi:hypothetical protein
MEEDFGNRRKYSKCIPYAARPMKDPTRKSFSARRTSGGGNSQVGGEDAMILAGNCKLATSREKSGRNENVHRTHTQTCALYIAEREKS